MRCRILFVGGALAASLAWTPAVADSLAATPTPAQADAEVQRLQAALRNAELAADGAREVEAARLEAERANRRVAEAEARLASAQPATPATGTETGTGSGSGAGTGSERPAASPPTTPPGRQKFGGIEFGVGLSFTLDVGTSDRVRDAALVNGIVRVKDEDNGVARIMLESHYFFTPHHRGLFGTPSQQWGHGPFVAIQPGTDNIIQAIGAGWMVGFRRPQINGEDTGQSFNIGLGVVVDPNTRILGDGILPNQPLPAGETEIRYTEEMQIGALLLFSFSF